MPTPTTAGSASLDPTPEHPAEQGSAPARGRRLPRGRRTWLTVATAVVVAALALAVGSLVRAPSDADVRDSALEAARVYSTSLTTFDARTLDEDAERVRRASTEQFAEQYDASIADLRATVDAEQTVSTGTVVGAGLEQLDSGTATVLVAVNQQLAGTTGEPRIEANRLRMVLERRDGRWLIGSVERL